MRTGRDPSNLTPESAMLLTKTFTPEVYARALESWSWIGVENKVPVLTSLFGDVFLQDAQGYWFLDSLEGTLTMVATTRDEMQTKLDTAEGQDNFLLGGLAMSAERLDILLKPDEVYDFKIPPVLGGKIGIDNIVTMDFVVSLNIAGQLHDQIRNLPPGTKIKGIQVT
jgi:hypothetical protein